MHRKTRRPTFASLLPVSSTADAPESARPSPWLRTFMSLSSLGLLLGATVGASACVITVNEDGGWWGQDADQCYEDYDDCLEDADDADEETECAEELDECLESCAKGDGADEADDDGASGGNSDAGDGDGETGDGETGDGDDDGEPPRDSDDDGNPPHQDTGGGEEDTGGETSGGEPDPDPACIDLHAACIAGAETLQDIEACEALFQNCIDPGPCDDPMCEDPMCPQDLLDACVDEYAQCSEVAQTAEEVLICGADFDLCVSEFDVGLCLPNYDDDLLDECLDQHELCVTCAADADGLEACQSTFDNCLEG